MTCGDERVTYVRQVENLGAAPNYNACYELAPPTEYFGWIAHDDLPRPHFLESCVAALDARPEATVAYSRTRIIDPYGNDIGGYPSRPDLDSPHAAVRLRNAIDQRNENYPVFGLMRRSALDRTHLHGSYSGSDRALVAELAMLGPLVELADWQFSLREHPERSVRTQLAKGRTRSRDVWFDTANRGRIVMPRWRRLRAYGRAIKDAPIPLREKLWAYDELARWLGDKNWKALGLDLYIASRAVVRRGIRSPMRESS